MIMTDAELVILSLIAEKPRHGYQIEQVIEEREMREWTELGFSSIYYLLNKLEAGGLIESALERPSGRGPARKVYTITEAGWETCRQGILEALSEPPRPQSMFLLGMSNLPAVSREEALAALKHYTASLAGRREHLQERMNIGQGAIPFHVGAMFDFSLTMIQAELAWLEKFIQQMEAQDGKERL
jgi:DNA-binding PadR family transcriptional regulator